MEVTIGTPALLFSAISLVMLAYTSRFEALSSLIRNLAKQYDIDNDSEQLKTQIKYLNFRLNLVRNMHVLGIVSFLVSLLSMYLIYVGLVDYGNTLFGLSVVIFTLSLIVSMLEVFASTKALKIVLGVDKLD